MKLFVPILDNGDGKVCARFMQAFINAFKGQQIHLAQISDSHPGRARNRAAAAFLETDCTHMLFIDADIVFTAEHIELLSACEEPILAGLYPKKNADELQWCINPLPGEEGKHVPAGQLVEIKRAGTGFLRIAREVFETLSACGEYRDPIAEPYSNHGKTEWDFFRSGVVPSELGAPGEWLSEDWFFCEMARSVGFKVMAHSGIQLRHIGVFEYPGKPDRLKWCPPQMRFHIERIWQGEYDIPEVKPRTVLDLGGNIGGFAMWATERWPGCSVESYEPHPENCRIFDMNLREEAGVKLHEFAVLQGGGEIELSEGANIGEHSFHHADKSKTVIVFAMPAASLKSAEFVKLDTEGCEFEILEALDLSETKGIALEYHRADDRKTISALLTGKGFNECGHEPFEPDRGILKFIKLCPQ